MATQLTREDAVKLRDSGASFLGSEGEDAVRYWNMLIATFDK